MLTMDSGSSFRAYLEMLVLDAQERLEVVKQEAEYPEREKEMLI